MVFTIPTVELQIFLIYIFQEAKRKPPPSGGGLCPLGLIDGSEQFTLELDKLLIEQLLRVRWAVVGYHV